MNDEMLDFIEAMWLSLVKLYGLFTGGEPAKDDIIKLVREFYSHDIRK